MMFKKRYRVNSLTDAGRHYTVTVRGLGMTIFFSCNCPHYVYRLCGKDGKEPCKHIWSVIDKRYPFLRYNETDLLPALL